MPARAAHLGAPPRAFAAADPAWMASRPSAPDELRRPDCRARDGWAVCSTWYCVRALYLLPSRYVGTDRIGAEGHVRSVLRRRAPRDSQVHLRPRSEEHTSELQSLMRISYAVFCLTKKKQKLC